MSLSRQEATQAVTRTARIARLKRLRPAGSQWTERFGSHPYDPKHPDRGGLEGSLAGKWEYHFPKAADPEKQNRINAQVLEMEEPWRRASTGDGAERNASTPSVRLRDTRGVERVLPESRAEATARRKGFVPVWRAGGARMLTDEEGYLYHADGTPTGHLHLPGATPLEATRVRCRGCREDR